MSPTERPVPPEGPPGLVLSPDDRFDWRLSDALAVYLYFTLLIAGIFALPADLVHAAAAPGIYGGLGLLGLWRFGWWSTHVVRAVLYQRRVYPRLRGEGAARWAAGARPAEVAFMMTTFREDPGTTRAVLDSIVAELGRLGLPGRLVIGTGDASDEAVIREHLARKPAPRLAVTFARQDRPGKRVAIGLSLRALSGLGLDGDTPVVFLDGDSILAPGCLERCLPLFQVEPHMDALTTLERAVVRGPRLVQSWLDLRFAQRHLTMCSHALSGKVLTLTGRLSVYRARAVLEERFIRTVEQDYLEDWLWGRFQFLSGDDKSTWFSLLERGSGMRYVPDALVYTVERIDGPVMPRVIQNLLRWSGNMLRNGRRALALGPRRVGPFVWWCILDQRVAMWTCLAGPVALLAGMLVDPGLLVLFPLWILLSRGLLAAMLWGWHRRLDVTFPFVLYANQLAASVVKVYLLFRLPIQRWANRGDQRAGEVASARRKRWIAAYLTVFWVVTFVLAVLLLVGVIPGGAEGQLVALADLFL